MNIDQHWQIWIDTGGTFTDCIAINPNGQKSRLKVLSNGCLRGKILQKKGPASYTFEHKWLVKNGNFEHYDFKFLSSENYQAKIKSIDLKRGILNLTEEIETEDSNTFEICGQEEAPILAARLATETALNQPLPPIDMRLGFTKGTNALLERKGAKVTLLITKGFKDLLLIGTQQRPHLFQLNIPDPEVLYDQVLEVDERIDAKGAVLSSIRNIDTLIPKIKNDTVAVALLHAYKNSAHEQQLKAALDAAGKTYISLSEELTPSIKFLPRTQTVLVNAYLTPIIHHYLENIKANLKDGNLKIMTSAGGLNNSELFHPKDSLLSGPAGGVVGAANISKSLRIKKVLTLDMGGTSTDTARFDSHLDYRFTTNIDDLDLSLPSLAIETVAAGGGSICFFENGRLQVGPKSAGAHPGPACYGAGGPLTITDVNLLLGKLDTNSIGIPINIEAAQKALTEIQQSIHSQTQETYSALEILSGFEQIANQKMAAAIRRISIAKGFDPKEYALLAFGGAGGLHACKIADFLEIRKIILPFNSGLLSAYGIGTTSVERLSTLQVNQGFETFSPKLPNVLNDLINKATQELIEAEIDPTQIAVKSQLIFLRFQGQDTPLEINFSKPEDILSEFENKYQQLFGHFPVNRPIEIESVKVIVASKEKAIEPIEFKDQFHEAWPVRKISNSYNPKAVINVYYWPNLTPNTEIIGPAVLTHDTSTAFIEAGWTLNILANHDAILERNQVPEKHDEALKEAIELELFTNRFTAIAEEMGEQLQRTAFSVNIKERLDFSCALLDSNANLLVNAPHIPVHLGSLGVCARLVREAIDLKLGDVVITNHPKYGGSHLPDITLLSGVFHEEQCIGYVINRAHHAELGGTRPGSMPPDATTLEEEGVVIPPTYLVKANQVNWENITAILNQATYPTRSISENLADINAALAALNAGKKALKSIVEDYGLQKVQFYMEQIKTEATRKLLQALDRIEGRIFKAEELLDDGSSIQIKITKQKSKLHFDFSGTSTVHPFNLNANPSIVHSAILYVLRILCNEEIPLNDGLMEFVEIKMPTSLLNPKFVDDPKLCPAVVGGNTEISQRLVDTLLKAFGLAACSQGTMNNFLFGNDQFGYYETIGGGTGAGPNFHGRSAVHQHMTNTKITDPEELEWRYPVRLNCFEIRKHSGGKGQWNGGDGIIRELTFLEPSTITLLAQHRKTNPYGLNGGSPGKTGEQYIERTDGWREYINGSESCEVGAGDRIVIKTPGGGAWGMEVTENTRKDDSSTNSVS